MKKIRYQLFCVLMTAVLLFGLCTNTIMARAATTEELQSNEDYLWMYFLEQGFSDEGIAGILGNLQAESALDPKNLQDRSNQQANVTDEEFTKLVDSGKIKRAEFISSSTYGVCNCGTSNGTEYGYGLAQWMYTTIKADLYDYCKAKNGSIGSLELQAAFIYETMSSSLKTYMSTVSDVEDATMEFHHVYEGGIDTKEQSQTRITMAKKLYEKHKGTKLPPKYPLEMPVVKLSNKVDGVSINWNAIEGAEKYKVYRKVSGGSFSSIATVSGNTTTFKDVNTEAGKTYIYTVKAVAKVGVSDYQGVSITYMEAPTVTKTVTSKGVKLSWKAAKNATGYAIYRKTAGGSFVKLANVNASTLSYTDRSAVSGQTYYYTVRSRQNSSFSSFYTGTSIVYLKAVQPTVKVYIGKNLVKWTEVEGATSYIVYRKTANGSWTKLTSVSGDTRTYMDQSTKAGVTYSYCVRAYNGSNRGSYISSNTVIAK